jgi:hypothetical protein
MPYFNTVTFTVEIVAGIRVNVFMIQDSVWMTDEVEASTYLHSDQFYIIRYLVL